MAGSVNKVILIGNLGRDPEVRFTQSGAKIVNFSIATSETWKDKQTGERREKTEWHRIVIFNDRLADVAEKYLRKGSKIYVEGALRTSEYEKDGIKRYSTEVVLERYRGELTMLDTRSGGGGGYDSGSGGGDSYGSSSTPASGGPGPDGGPPPGGNDLDDEIPF